ncbi:MAG: phosphoribosyltransferase [Bacilli bacterium]|nr:phosphoribosyltransferase [Bacilli bacterium]
MNYQELSIKSLREVDKNLYDILNKEYKYDLVIFVAKGAYLIGKDFAEINKCPLLEISASRSGGKLKKIISPLLRLIPEKLKIYLRKKEVNSNVHASNTERNVSFNSLLYDKYRHCKRVLLVDDSVDTGYTIKYAKEAIEGYFDDATVKVAALNCFDKANDIIKIDWCLFRNTMLKGPWSNDSKENKKFLKMYYAWKEGNDQ